jgi:asparagine synthase (glutamine-hydrolysing)
MCGIAGFFNIPGELRARKDRLFEMTRSLQHRGPDSEGYFLKNQVGLGHRRLSIIDLDSGNQPMLSDDQSVAIIFNGEIYNYVELRKELISLGHKFHTQSDTEVIIQAYREWGVHCQQKFNGMWAFALWDEQEQTLFLSRDRIGEKPLFYSYKDGQFYFASELKALFKAGIKKEIRTELTEIYLAMTFIPEPDTFYKNIYKLKAGHYLLVNTSGIKEKKYWDLPEIDEHNMLNNEEYAYNQFEELLSDSVRIRMRCDVKYGAFLSGGLDSASIVSLMTKNSSHPIESYTIGFPEKDFDESKLASDVAKKFRTNHHIGTVKSLSLEEIQAIASYHFDEPFGDSSSIATWQVANFAARDVKMVLTGDGGDEVLSGYKSFTGIKLAKQLRKVPFSKQMPQFVKQLKKPVKGNLRYTLNRVQDHFETANLPFALRMLQKRCYTPLADIKHMMSTVLGVIPVEEFYSNLIQQIPYNDEFYKLMYINLKFDLPNDYLVKVDRMAMANSLETRTPFLDYRLIEFMVGVHKHVKHRHWERKSVLRNSVGKQLPESVLNAPKKGFGVPLREWFKQDAIINNFNLSNLKSFLNEKQVETIIDENKSGARDNGNFIWTLFMLNEYLT